MGYDSDEERKVHKGSVNLLALDKWDTSQLLVLKQQHNLVHPRRRARRPHRHRRHGARRSERLG